MFKRSLLTAVLAGLITGSVKPVEQKTNILMENVQKLRNSINNSYFLNRMGLMTSGAVAVTALSAAMIGIFGDVVTENKSFFGPKDILAKDFVSPIKSNLMVFGVFGLIAAYNAMVLQGNKSKMKALDEIE